MLLILEIAFLLAGLWAIFTGKLPPVLFGGGPYTAEGPAVRLLGLLLIVPLPLAFVAGVALALFFGEDATVYGLLFEIVMVIIVALLASVIYRRIRQPISAAAVAAAESPEALIAKKANGALVYAFMGIFGLTVLIVCPLAVIYANQALRLIETNPAGERYRKTAQWARVLAVVFFGFYAVVGGCLVIAVVIGRGLGQG